MSPEISAILWAPDSYKTILKTLKALQQQTMQDQIEVILIGPSYESMKGVESYIDGFWEYQILDMFPITDSATVRVNGIMAAKAPVVAFMQDHCFPVATLLLIIDGFGEAVGYFLGPGNAMVWITSIEYNRHRFMVDEDL